MKDYNKAPEFHILVSQIFVWEIDDKTKIFDPPTSPIVISEVESIEILESYKKFISTATVNLPRGAVIKKILTPDNLDGVLANSSLFDDSMDFGVNDGTVTYRSSVADFKVGKRIKIKIGYARTEEEAKQALRGESSPWFKEMFDGFIVQCGMQEPISLKCENIASCLKKITCPNIRSKDNLTVSDLLSDTGKYQLLKSTGFKMHSRMNDKNCKINIGYVDLTDDLTIADVFATWNQRHLSTFLEEEDGEMKIAVGRSYFNSTKKDSIVYGTMNNIPEIHSDYHVAEDNLSLSMIDPAFLAVEANGIKKDGRFYKITVRLNPEYDPAVKSGNKSKKWQTLNETVLSKKDIKAGLKSVTKRKEKIDLSTYSIISYTSTEVGVTPEKLAEEAQVYFEGYNKNGIEGSLTLFGDLALKPRTRVKYIDKRYPDKSGYYVVEEVLTRFGVNGYRQTIKLPYRLKKIE